VAGSIKRARLEKTEPSISYEAFVEELDCGDAFTASLVDVLVQEMAERRTRQNTADRRLIADRTVKSLRFLATSSRLYRDRPTMRGRAVNLTEYLSAPPDEDVEEEEDEFDTIMDNGPSSIEGARVNPDLYEAYYSSAWSSAPASSIPRRSLPPFPSLSGVDGPTQPSTSIRNNAWNFSAAPGPLLQRQTYNRRSTRSRAEDFNDFTSRRRSSIRHNAENSSMASMSDNLSEDFPPTIVMPSDDESPPPVQPSDQPSSLFARRFFPVPRSRSRREVALRRNEMHGSLTEPNLLLVEPNVSSPWLLPTPMSSSSSLDAESSEERIAALPPVPRLRRGGVRAPESIRSQRASPLGDLTRAPRGIESIDPIYMPPSPRSPLGSEEARAHPEDSATVARSDTFTPVEVNVTRTTTEMLVPSAGVAAS